MNSTIEIGLLVGVALAEVVALEHLSDRVHRGQLQQVRQVHRLEPLGVTPDLEVVLAQDVE